MCVVDWKSWALDKWRKGKEKVSQAAATTTKWGKDVAQKVKGVFTRTDDDGKRSIQINKQGKLKIQRFS